MRWPVIHFRVLVRNGARWLGRALTLVSAVHCMAAERPQILVLYSNDRLLPANQEMEKGLRRAFSGEVGNPSADLFGEFLDAVRFPSPEFGTAMEQFLKARHRDNPPELCISIGPQALDFLMQRRDSLFPGVPVVFGGVTPARITALPAVSDLAGRPMDWSITPLTEIRPEIRKVLLIAGTAEFDRLRHEEAMGQIEPFRDRYEFESSVGQDLHEVLERVSKLPDAAESACPSYSSLARISR